MWFIYGCFGLEIVIFSEPFFILEKKEKNSVDYIGKKKWCLGLNKVNETYDYHIEISMNMLLNE